MIPLLVIRHAPTEWNEAGRIQGRADMPLSNAGRRQAAAWRLPAPWTGATCLSSPLKRAMETARLLGLDPKPEPRLIEMDWGEWEGSSLAGLRRELAAEMTRNETLGLDFRPRGGESPREVQERLSPLIGSLTGSTIAVTHKGVLRALYAMATGWEMTAKPKDRLLDGCAHCFQITPDGAPVIDALNVPLVPAA